MYLFREVGALAHTPLNADGGAKEGVEGDAAAAFPNLTRGPNLPLVRDLENHVTR